MLDRPFTRGVRDRELFYRCIPESEYRDHMWRRLSVHPFWWWLSGLLMGAFFAKFGFLGGS